jgi:hypothetical protein
MNITNLNKMDNIHYKRNHIKYAISNNDPIENKLNVIVVISNPCLYSKRYKLFREFVKRFEKEEPYVELFIVELVYKNQKFIITDKNNKNHLQLRTVTPIWHKENMINLGVKNLLPVDWKAFAWIDADIEFENNSWAIDTLKILNGYKDVVQIFSHAIDMDSNELSMNHYNGFGYSFCKNKIYTAKGLDYWHPGYAWAITRKAYEKMGGLYDKAVLGSGDTIMALSFINNVKKMMNNDYSYDYNNSMLEFQKKSNTLRLGYTPGVIRHYFHGTKENRKYTERCKILFKYKYSPLKHLKYDDNGILVPSENFEKEFKTEILQYFKDRKEDD